MLLGAPEGGGADPGIAQKSVRECAGARKAAAAADLTNRQVGEKGGTETVTLTSQQMPNHNHVLSVSPAPGTSASPIGALPADGGNGSAQYTQDTANLQKQPAQNLGVAGESQPHENMQPFLAVNYIISLYGTFPF